MIDDYQKAIFEKMRRLYASIDITDYDPYPMNSDWNAVFSPIERMTWGEIRGYGLPFWPQFPIGRYFADFADPIKKIVIECDGAKYHKDRERDRRRDSDMGEGGYVVYRVPGAVCARVLPTASEIIEQDSDPFWIEDVACIHAIREWYFGTVDGLIAAIAEKHYGLSCHIGNVEEDSPLFGIADAVLKKRIASRG